MAAIQYNQDDSQGTPVPVSKNNPLPVMTPDQGVAIDQSAPGYSNGVVMARYYPASAIPFGVSSGNAANAVATATAPAQGGKTYYLTTLTITATGATSGLAVAPTVTGLVNGTRTYAFGYPAGVLVPAQPTTITFWPPVPSTTNTAVVATLPASGSGGTNATINIEGFYL